MSIRYKIFGVFSILIVLACGLAYLRDPRHLHLR